MSKVIVVEGLDGAGKATAINTIVTCLNLEGVPNVVLREPGSTEIGEWLRNYVKSLDTPQLDPNSELLLFFLSRSVLVNDVIKPKLKEGTVVILDRFYRTTVAYQGQTDSTRGLINDLVSGLKLDELVDLEILLDIPVDVSRSRVDLRFTDCQIEKRSDEFFNKAREIYLAEAEANSYIKAIDANRDIDSVSDSVTEVINNFIVKELK